MENRGWKFQPGFSQGFFWSSQPPAHFWAFTFRSMNFTSLTCPLSKSLESHGSPILPKYGLRLKQVTDGGKHQVVQGLAVGGTHSPGPVYSRQRGRATRFHCSAERNATRPTSDPITLRCALSWDMNASLMSRLLKWIIHARVTGRGRHSCLQPAWLQANSPET